MVCVQIRHDLHIQLFHWFLSYWLSELCMLSDLPVRLSCCVRRSKNHYPQRKINGGRQLAPRPRLAGVGWPTLQLVMTRDVAKNLFPSKSLNLK
jgi:hypothetical protein